MAKESVKIELNQKDIIDLVSEKWNLDPKTTTISVSHYKGDAREAESTNIVVTGQKKQLPS